MNAEWVASLVNDATPSLDGNSPNVTIQRSERSSAKWRPLDRVVTADEIVSAELQAHWWNTGGAGHALVVVLKSGELVEVGDVGDVEIPL